MLIDFLGVCISMLIVFFLVLVASVPFCGTRVVEGDVRRQNRTSPRKLCCLPLTLLSGRLYLHGIHGNK